MQKEVLALPAKGHTVILGTAGSGKTTMALWRAIFLTNLPTHPNVLVVTFNMALVKYMRAMGNLNKKNLTIENYHKFARGYLDNLGKMPKWNGVVNPDDKEYYINEALEYYRCRFPEESTFRRPVSIFIDEISFIQKFGIETLEQYLDVERIGRASVNIKRENRKYFFAIYKEYMRLREQKQQSYDWDDMALYVYKELQNDIRKRRYDHVIVDEGQDFSPMMVKSLIAATNVNGSFTFLGDVAQQIYGSRLSWRDSGININDNGIWKFDVNYRNPAIISAFAKDIANSKYWEHNTDMISPTSVIAEGPKPVLIQFKTREKEVDWIIKMIRANVNISSNVIICRNRAIVDEFFKVLKRIGIFPTIIDRNQAGFGNIKGVCLSTFHAVKGLEFENVFVPYLSEGIFPDGEILENAVSKTTVLSDELKLLYVAATRSKYGLFMSYHQSLSRLFPEKSINYDSAEGDN
ncbi:DNA helicase [Lacrimispora celerecrescens]|uniref:DNA 3'-5' helicase n=2 Tax=Lacrimispora celerecrescens TaxID=29354 RepID=A0A084JJZ4_9FIRM|nr:DNA helicase [Lacrimispora celerecrescens]